MLDRGGESSSPSIEILDGITDSNGSVSTQRGLPLPVGQLFAIFGLLLMAVGAFTLASGADTSSPLGESELVGQLDCNDDGTLCRYISPTGFVSWLCVAPCDLPPSVGFGQEVFVFGGEEGIPIGGVAIGRNGELNVDENGVGGSGVPIRVGPDGRIQLAGDLDGDGVRIELGRLGPDNLDNDIDRPDSVENDRPDGEISPPNDQTNSSSRGIDFGALTRLLAPIVILVGVCALGFGLFAIVRSIQDRSRQDGDDDDEPREDSLRDRIEEQIDPEASPTDGMTAVAEERVRIVSDLIADLRAEPDPSLAIQRAYAALETGFGNPNLARLPSETCSTYLHRTIGMVGGVSEPLRTLTMLFELARFSTEPIDETMRGQAIDALIDVRAAWSSRTSRSRPALGTNDRPSP